MAKITFNQRGDFARLTRYLEKAKKKAKIQDLDKYGRAGVEALRSATPVDTGKTANSWSYVIERNSDSVSIIFKNSNVNRGVNIALILQYGHGTKNGGWVEGRDYINPALQPVFDRLAEDAWREVTSV